VIVLSLDGGPGTSDQLVHRSLSRAGILGPHGRRRQEQTTGQERRPRRSQR
jgi:hypothetical protein